MQTQWELTLRGRMLALLASLATCGAWMTGDPQACLGAALLLAPLLVDALWRIGGVPELLIEVRPRRSQAGALFDEVVEVRNTNPQRTLHDLHFAEPQTRTRDGAALIETLAPGSASTVTLQGRVWKRGRFPSRGFEGETCYPLGLIRNRLWIEIDEELLIEPGRARLPVDALESRDDSLGDASARSFGRDEFYALRDYRLGEDARTVHALRSAANGQLVAKELRGQTAHHTCLVIDLRRAPGYIAGTPDRAFEWAISAAATLTDQLPSRSASVRAFLLDDKTTHAFTLDHGTGADDLLAQLAEVRPANHRGLTVTELERLREFDACVWVAAGGFAARDERSALRSVRLLRHRRRA